MAFPPPSSSGEVRHQRSAFPTPNRGVLPRRLKALPQRSGSYVLQSVNGKPLPVTWNFNSGDSLRIRSYSISINGNGSWTSALSQVFSTGGVVTDQPNGGQSGSYSYDAATKAVTLISSDQSTLLNGNVSTDFTTLTLAQNTDLFVFKR